MKVVSLLYVLLIVALVWSADQGALPGWLAFHNQIPFGDKVGHFLLFGMFSLAINGVTCFKRVKVFGRSVFLGVLITLLFVTIEEFSQLFIAQRTFSLLDLLANILGIVLLGQWFCWRLFSWFRGGVGNPRVESFDRHQ
jgi:VanZ family protein